MNMCLRGHIRNQTRIACLFPIISRGVSLALGQQADRCSVQLKKKEVREGQQGAHLFALTLPPQNPTT